MTSFTTKQLITQNSPELISILRTIIYQIEKEQLTINKMLTDSIYLNLSKTDNLFYQIQLKHTYENNQLIINKLKYICNEINQLNEQVM